MRKRIEALRQEVLDLQKRSIQYNILKREVDTNRELHASLLQRFKEVDVASGVGVNNVFVVDRAQIPGAPSSPGLMHVLLMALALGLGAGFGAAYLLERLDDKIRTVEQAEQVAGMSTLGIIPRASDVKEELADPRLALCESYRSLHRIAVLDGKRLAQEPSGDKLGAVRGKVADVVEHRQALRLAGTQGAAGRRRPAQSVAAYDAQCRQLCRVQQLPDRRLRPA
jgi:G-rich domain on putative tyrosine kinase